MRVLYSFTILELRLDQSSTGHLCPFAALQVLLCPAHLRSIPLPSWTPETQSSHIILLLRCLFSYICSCRVVSTMARKEPIHSSLIFMLSSLCVYVSIGSCGGHRTQADVKAKDESAVAECGFRVLVLGIKERQILASLCVASTVCS